MLGRRDWIPGCAGLLGIALVLAYRHFRPPELRPDDRAATGAFAPELAADTSSPISLTHSFQGCWKPDVASAARTLAAFAELAVRSGSREDLDTTSDEYRQVLQLARQVTVAIVEVSGTRFDVWLDAPGEGRERHIAELEPGGSQLNLVAPPTQDIIASARLGTQGLLVTLQLRHDSDRSSASRITLPSTLFVPCASSSAAALDSFALHTYRDQVLGIVLKPVADSLRMSLQELQRVIPAGVIELDSIGPTLFLPQPNSSRAGEALNTRIRSQLVPLLPHSKARRYTFQINGEWGGILEFNGKLTPRGPTVVVVSSGGGAHTVYGYEMVWYDGAFRSQSLDGRLRDIDRDGNLELIGNLEIWRGQGGRFGIGTLHRWTGSRFAPLDAQGIHTYYPIFFQTVFLVCRRSLNRLLRAEGLPERTDAWLNWDMEEPDECSRARTELSGRGR